MSVPRKIPVLLALALLSGCGVSGPPEPTLSLPAVDMHTDLGKIDGSAVLAAPTGWTPAPTLRSPTFATPAPQLLATMQALLLAEPRTWVMDTHPDALQASFIVRSVMLNLPDIVVVQAVPASATTSQAVILSRSRYDGVPFISANKARVTKLVDQLMQRFGTVPDPPPAKAATPAAKAP